MSFGSELSAEAAQLPEADRAAIVRAGGLVSARALLGEFWRRCRTDRVTKISLGWIAGVVVVAIFAPLIVSLVGAPGPNAQNPRLLDLFHAPTGPSFSHHDYLGVDPLGRDVFARVLYGARVSLIVAVISAVLSIAIGATAGIVAAVAGGWVDTAISRSIDVLLVFPILLLALGLGAACSLGGGCAGGLIEPGLGVAIVVITLVNSTYIARILYRQVVALREREFVEAARALGASNSRIVFHELLPNLEAPIIVYAALIIPQSILFEAALSYLGIGARPPTASWGAMLADASKNLSSWWYMLFPGVALLLTVLAFNLVADELRDALRTPTGAACP